MKRKLVSCVALVAGVLVVSALGALPQDAEALSDSGEVGRVLDREGVAARRAVLADRWSPVEAGTAVQPGDWLEVGTRGANALALELAGGARSTLGPGTLLEVRSAGRLLLSRGEIAVDATGADPVEVHGPGDLRIEVDTRAVLRAEGGQLVRLGQDPGWLVGYRSNASTEALGSLLANVDGRNVPLTIGYHKVTVDVRDQIARTVIEESFENHTSSILEGVFYFPLPAGASISSFGMWIGGELVQGDIVEKQRAREIYETILREKRDPGLLEWTGGNIFKARVYPIGSEKRIRIAYTQVLGQREGQFSYDYALQSELLRKTPLRRLEITVNVWSSRPLASVECPSHPCRIRTTEHSARVDFAADEFAPERDFQLLVGLAPGAAPLTLIPHRRGDDGYFMLLVDAPSIEDVATPDPDEAEAPIELLILADTSGSMWGPPRASQVAFIEALASSLGADDRFNLATCDVDTRWAFEQAQPTDFATRERALAFLEERDPLGWTDLGQALAAVCERAGPNTHVVYVGDGVPTSGSADPVELAHEIERMFRGKGTFHAVVPGPSSEMVVLRALAALGGGSVRSIGGGSDPARTAFAFLEEITAPAVKDLEIAFDGLEVAAVYPRRLPNLPAGGQQIVVGRFDPTLGPLAGKVRVTGRAGGEPVQFETDVALGDEAENEDSSFIPRLWARHHLDNLLDQGSSDAVRQRIIALSEDYQIVTPYSSFLVLESDADRERFGVQKRFRMRDGEEFFTAGREGARHELLREQMLAARGWRRELRERVLLSLEGLGRELSELLRGDAPTLDQVVALGGLRFGGELGQTAGSDSSFRRSESERFDWNEGWSADKDGKEDDSSLAERDELADVEEEEPLLASPAESKAMERVAHNAPMSKRARRQIMAEGRLSGLAGSFADQRGYGVPYYHDPFDALFPPVAGPRTATPLPDWPEEVVELLTRIDRRASLLASTRGWRLRVRTDYVDARERPRTAEGTHLIGPDAWLTLAPHAEGQVHGVDWSYAGRRGTLLEGWRLGRVRTAQAEDAGAWAAPFAWSFGDRVRQYSGYEAELASPGEGRATITLWLPATPEDRLVLTIDPERGLVLEEAWFRAGEKMRGQRYEDFVEVGGLWWPGRIHGFVTGEDESNSGRSQITVETLAAGELVDAVRAELERRADALLLDDAKTSVTDAKQAVRDGTATLEQHWALLRHFARTQRWSAATPHFDAIVEREAGKPGLRPLRLVWLRESRRNEELRLELLRTAEWLAAGVRDGDHGLATELLQHTYSLHQGSEILALLDALAPVCDRRANLPDARLPFARRRLQALANVGRPTELFEAHVRAAAEWPFDLGFQTALAQQLAQRGEVDQGLAHLATVEAEHGPWQPHERAQLRGGAARILWGSYRLEELRTTLEAWEREDPTALDGNLHGQYLSVLVYLDRESAARELVQSWLALAARTEREPHELARLHAAIQHALGQGHELYHQRFDDDTAELLASTARELIEHEGDTHLAGWILQHWRFRETDAGRALLTQLFHGLHETGDELPAWQVHALVGWLRGAGFSRDDGEKAWEDVLEAVYQRWFALPDGAERVLLAQVVATHGNAALRIRYYRQTLEEAGDPSTRVAAAHQLARALLAERWSAPVEEEIVSLISAMSLEGAEAPDSPGAPDPPGARERNTDARALLVYDLVDWIVRERTAAIVLALPDHESMTRRTLRAERDKARATVRTSAVDLLGALEPRLEPKALRDWARIERVSLLVASRERLSAARTLSLELLDKRIDGLAVEDASAMPLRERILAQRCIATCTFLLASGDPDDLEQDEAELRNELDRLTDTSAAFPDGRAATRDLLIALDRAEELTTLLETWYDDGTTIEGARWGRDLAHLFAERGALEDAIRVLEGVAGQDELGEQDLRALSDWYTALDRADLAREAKLRSYEVLGEDALASDLYQRSQAYRRTGDDVPPELDPEIPLRLSALMRKARDPQQRFWVLRDLYASTKDYRLLECLPHAVLGHTSQSIYPFLAQVANLATMIDEEATVDRIRTRLAELRRDAGTDVDRRALALLEFQIVLRAARQSHGTEQHAERSLSALRASFSGQWQDGEIALMAEFLANQGRLQPQLLADEQLRQLRALRSLADDADERFAAASHLANVLWGYGQQDEAIQALEAALAKRRGTAGGPLPDDAHDGLRTLSDWLVTLRHFRRVETLWHDELAIGYPEQRVLWLRAQLFELYRDAVLARGELSLGTGDALYAAVTEAFQAELETRTHEQHATQLVQLVCDLWQGAHRQLQLTRAREDVVAFGFGVLPRVLDLYQYRGGQQMVARVADCLQSLAGPESTLEFLVARAENEPGWLRLRNQDFWSQHAWRFAASLRPDGQAGARHGADLERRALAVVQRELREDLRTRQARSRYVYDERYGHYWARMRGEFLDTTLAFAEERSDAPRALVYVAEYLFHGLSAHTEAIDLLTRAHRRGILHLEGRDRLATYLQLQGRWTDSVPVVRGLIEERPAEARYRVMLMRGHFHTSQLAALLGAFEEAESELRATGHWTEGVIATLAEGCLETELLRDCVRLYDDAIALRVRTAPRRGVGDGVLCTYYRNLSDAHAGLGRTADAVDAAAGAIVAWGHHTSQRADELRNLVSVLERASDLEGYVTELDGQIRTSGLENPIVRKALGQAWLGRGEFERAAEQLTLALRSRPNDVETHRLLLDAYDRQERPDLAAHALLEWCRQAGHELGLYVELGRRLEALERDERAERTFTNLVELSPHESEGQRLLAETRERQERWQEAAERWRQVMRIRSGEPTGYLGLARSLIRMERFEEAREVIEELRTRPWPPRFGDVHRSAEALLTARG